MESVSCKDWLVNKVDRSVTGLIACQQCTGEIQLPLNNLGVTAIGYDDNEGIATSIGHAPAIALINSEAGSRMAIAEALTNMVWTPIEEGIKSVSLSANWMWPCKNDGEDGRLYDAVRAASDFAIALGINIPTGKDSLSMTQKYPNGEKVLSPGTLIISTVGPAKDIRKTVHPNLTPRRSDIIWIPFTKAEDYPLGGSVYAQTMCYLGDATPDVEDAEYFAKCFNTIQELISEGHILAGHDISAGGLITTLLESCFPNTTGGLYIDLSFTSSNVLFCEAPGVIIQTAGGQAASLLTRKGINFYEIGEWQQERKLTLKLSSYTLDIDIDRMRDIWYKTSYLFDQLQSGEKKATERYSHYKLQPLTYRFPNGFSGKKPEKPLKRPVAAIIREKGSNGEREMAWALYLSGFEVKDVHTTDLTSGRETLDEVQLVVFVGGFSNADTLGSAKGWAGTLMFNRKAKEIIERFYARENTLSLGVCNGCQLMGELGFITLYDRSAAPKLRHNASNKFESGFVGVTIPESPSIMLKSLQGCKLGVWIAHGEGKFEFPRPISEYNVALRYSYDAYPANPNGSPEAIAGVCSEDGRHLAMMPHPERCVRPWNWAYYPHGHRKDAVTPWIEMFVNARNWCEKSM
jgi:phosphoribosylformylglycinamidine synthase